MKQQIEITKVAFRMFEGEVTAFMPEVPATNSPYTCTCYAHLGQHGGADVSMCANTGRPATEAEYKPLLAELKSIGYKVKVIKRMGASRYLDVRRKELQKYFASKSK